MAQTRYIRWDKKKPARNAETSGSELPESDLFTWQAHWVASNAAKIWEATTTPYVWQFYGLVDVFQISLHLLHHMFLRFVCCVWPLNIYISDWTLRSWTSVKKFKKDRIRTFNHNYQRVGRCSTWFNHRERLLRLYVYDNWKSYFLGVFVNDGEDNFLQNPGPMTSVHRVKRSTKTPYYVETLAVFDYGFYNRLNKVNLFYIISFGGLLLLA